MATRVAVGGCAPAAGTPRREARHRCQRVGCYVNSSTLSKVFWDAPGILRGHHLRPPSPSARLFGLPLLHLACHSLVGVNTPALHLAWHELVGDCLNLPVLLPALAC